MSSGDKLSCTNSSGLCLEIAADYRIHTSCDHVFLKNIKSDFNDDANSIPKKKKILKSIHLSNAAGSEFCFRIFSPKASLIWPLRPHLVRSSTGLNHMISSVRETKRTIKCELKSQASHTVIFCIQSKERMRIFSHPC